MPKTFCVVGHDARQQAAARVLRRAGYGVSAADNAAAADYILLPMSQGRVSDEVARALQGAGQGTWIFAGRPGMPVRTAVRQANLPLVDYFLRPELESLNAVPTAEGCLELLLRLRQRTIWESDFLVLGYGRVGRAVARRLGLLGGRVAVAARSAEQRANARCAGCRAATLAALRGLLPVCEEGYITLSCTTAGGSGTLRAFYCDSVRVNGRDLGRQLVAVSPDIYGDSGFQGVWRMEEQEGAHELVQAALE